MSSWVGQRVAYIPGSSRPIDGAVATLLSREGVCRDFAHLVIALLRACDTPARLVSVYAPGLQPMDFHAVAEAYIDGRWLVADATALAPRSSMVRIATGRDAADTAFLTSTGAEVRLVSLRSRPSPKVSSRGTTQPSKCQELELNPPAQVAPGSADPVKWRGPSAGGSRTSCRPPTGLLRSPRLS